VLRVKTAEHQGFCQMIVGHADLAASLFVERGEVEMLEEAFAPIIKPLELS
jgi:hypothetical protein